MKKVLLFLLTVLTVSLAASADVTINSTNFPDANFRAYLMTEYPTGVITTTQLNARTELDLYNKGISNAKGIEYFTNLTRLDLYANNLTSVVVMHNTKLTYLNVGNNKLAGIDVTANTALQELYLQNNKITSLSVYGLSNLKTLWVHGNTTMTELNCYRNNLTNFNITGNTALTSLKCYENSNLTKITGLANCTALTYLDCEDCAITDLSDLSGMNNLNKLYCRNNKLTSLDVSNKRNLVYLRVQGNRNMTELRCYDCNLSTLNVYSCTALARIYCNENPSLTVITGLGDCTALTLLNCGDCALTTLAGVAGKTNLTDLYCYNNDLSSIDVTGCTKLKYFYCYMNNITGSGMTNLVNSLPNRSTKGFLELIYDEEEGNTVNDEQLSIAINKNWRVQYLDSEIHAWVDFITLDQALNVLVPTFHFVTDDPYPWVVVKDGNSRTFAQSGNGGIHNSTSTLTATVTITKPGTTLYFDYKAWGEGSSTYWDKCQFSVDGEEKFSQGALQNEDWLTCQTVLPPGTHTLTWSYTKDSSVNPEGDYFAIDNVYLNEPSYIRGDVDDDGNVNISDVSALIDYLLTGDESYINYMAADCDQSGDVGISDVPVLIDYLLTGSW